MLVTVACGAPGAGSSGRTDVGFTVMSYPSGTCSEIVYSQMVPSAVSMTRPSNVAIPVVSVRATAVVVQPGWPEDAVIAQPSRSLGSVSGVPSAVKTSLSTTIEP